MNQRLSANSGAWSLSTHAARRTFTVRQRESASVWIPAKEPPDRRILPNWHGCCFGISELLSGRQWSVPRWVPWDRMSNGNVTIAGSGASLVLLLVEKER